MEKKETRGKRKKESNIVVKGYRKDGQPMTKKDWEKVSELYTEVMIDWYNKGIIGA